MNCSCVGDGWTIVTFAGLGEEVSMRQVRGRGTPDWNSWAQWVTVSGGLGGFVDSGGGMGRERE